MSDLNDRIDEEIRKGKYIEEALKQNADINSPSHDEGPPPPPDNKGIPANVEQEPPVQQPQGNARRGEQEQPETAVTDTAQDNLQTAQQQDDQRGERRGGQIDLDNVSHREGAQEEEREQGTSPGGMNTSSSTSDTGRISPTHAGSANSRERGSANSSDMGQTGGEPPAGGSDKP